MGVYSFARQTGISIPPPPATATEQEAEIQYAWKRVFDGCPELVYDPPHRAVETGGYNGTKSAFADCDSWGTAGEWTCAWATGTPL